MMDDCPIKDTCVRRDNAPEDCNVYCLTYNLWHQQQNKLNSSNISKDIKVKEK